MHSAGPTVLLTLSVLGAAFAAPTTAPTTRPLVAGGMRIFTDLKYGDATGNANLLDLYLPAKSDGKPRPVVMWVHGGANMGGDKSPCGAQPFVEAGFVVA